MCLEDVTCAACIGEVIYLCIVGENCSLGSWGVPFQRVQRLYVPVCMCVCVGSTRVCELLSLAMGYINPRLTVVKPAFRPWQCSRAVKCSPKRRCWAQLQLSSWKDAHPAHIPDNTDICHTPCPSYTGELSTKAVARFLLAKKRFTGQTQGAMSQGCVATGTAQHAKTDTHDGERTDVIPSLTASES